ncbi:hypothetical protein ACG30_14840 [Listeria monocytogenes]|nr:hypothetical protein [Listeria monocytogenes]
METFDQQYNRLEQEKERPDFVDIIPHEICDQELASAVVEKRYKRVLNKQNQMEFIPDGERVLAMNENLSDSLDMVNKWATPVDVDGEEKYSPFTVENVFKRTHTTFTGQEIAVEVPQLVSEQGSLRVVTEVVPTSKDFARNYILREERKLGLSKEAKPEPLTLEQREQQTADNLVHDLVANQLSNFENPSVDGNIVLESLRKGIIEMEDLQRLYPENYNELLS